MIIGTSEEQKIGDIIEGTYYVSDDIQYPNTKIYILRDATYDDWVLYRKEMNLELYSRISNPRDGFYYLVSHD